VSRLACPALQFVNPSSCNSARHPGRQLPLYHIPPPNPPSSLRASRPARTRHPLPRAPAIYDCVARHSRTRFYPRARKSRSSFPHFDFSKRGFCARHARENTPEPDLWFSVQIARTTRQFACLPRSCPDSPCGFAIPKQGETRFRPLSQSACDNRATKPRWLTGPFAPPISTRRSACAHRQPLTSQPSAGEVSRRSNEAPPPVESRLQQPADLRP
jgi:hypothetical protein